ncbi:MAG: TonB-dependent siderophore receptor [Paracoccus aminovorans]|nr:TonB-dependent siderophore receptor [Paracoccus aminovorans]
MSFRILCSTTAIGLALSLAVPAAVAQTATQPKKPAATDDELVLDTVVLTATSQSQAETSYVAPSTIGRIETAPREIPATVSTYTAKRIEEQNIRSNLDLMQSTPGVDVTSNEGFFRIRGFGAQVALDGVSVGNFVGRTSADLSAFEQVEILKGPASLFQGNGSPGGTVNYTFKRPFDREALTARLGFGDPSSKTLMVDYNLAPALDGRLRARFVGSFEDRDLFTRPEYLKRSSLYGVTEFDLTDSTTLRLSAWQARNEINQSFRQGMPTWSDGTLIDFPVDTTVSQDWNRFYFKARWVNLDLEHEFNESWSAKLSYKYGKSDHPSYYGEQVRSCPDGLGIPGYGDGIDRANPDGRSCFVGSYWSDTNDVEVYDASVTGKFDAFGRSHDVVFGFSQERSWFRRAFGSADPSSTYVVDIFDPDHHVIDRPEIIVANPIGGKGTPDNTYTLFANANIKATDRLHFPITARLTWLKTSEGEWTAKHEFTPSLAAVYEVNDQITVYGQFARMFTANTSSRAWRPEWTPGVAHDTTEGTLLPNVTGTQKEIGVKAEVFGGLALASASIFEIKEQNKAMTDPESLPGGSHPAIGGDTFMIAIGEQRSRGVELGLSGEVRPGWSVGLGYAYIDAEYTKHDTRTGVQVGTARHSGNLWTNYSFQSGSLEGFSLGGGIRFSGPFMGSATDADDTNRVKGPGYGVVSARVGYQINENFSAALNVDNLFDKKYYEILGSRGGSNYHGEARRVSLSVQSRF